MFENAVGEVVLGEFTPFSAYGNYHCAAKLVDGCVDSCFLGRMWKENSLANDELYEYKVEWEKRPDGKMIKRQMLYGFEGGPSTPAPEYLKDWCKLSSYAGEMPENSSFITATVLLKSHDDSVSQGSHTAFFFHHKTSLS